MLCRLPFQSNVINTAKYNVFSFLPLNLYEQFCRISNLYFLLIIILQVGGVGAALRVSPGSPCLLWGAVPDYPCPRVLETQGGLTVLLPVASGSVSGAPHSLLGPYRPARGLAQGRGSVYVE